MKVHATSLASVHENYSINLNEQFKKYAKQYRTEAGKNDYNVVVQKIGAEKMFGYNCIHIKIIYTLKALGQTSHEQDDEWYSADAPGVQLVSPVIFENHAPAIVKKIMDAGCSGILVKTGKIAFNPLEEVNRRKNNNPPDDKRIPLSSEEIVLFLDAIKTDEFNPPCSRYPHAHYYPFFYFIFNTGCRNSEVIGLRVKNVNLSKGYIYIREVLARTKEGTNSKARIWKTTKTGKQRIIPMTAGMKTLLQQQIKGKKPDDLVFTSHTGLCIDDRMLQRRVMKPVMEKLGIGDKVLYVARHSFSTIAIEQGFSPVEVSKIVGNSPETLIRNYLHLTNIPKRMPDIMDLK